MSKLMIAVIAGTLAATAVAQTTMQKLETPTDKAKQAEVQAITKGGGNNDATGQAAAAGSAVAKAEKAQPKALPTTKDKQAAAAAVSKSQAYTSSSGLTAAKGSVAAAAQKGTPKALPTTKDKQEAVDAATKAGAKNN